MDGCQTESCVTVCCARVLKPVQTLLSGFSALRHDTTFGLVSLFSTQKPCLRNSLLLKVHLEVGLMDEFSQFCDFALTFVWAFFQFLQQFADTVHLSRRMAFVGQ